MKVGETIKYRGYHINKHLKDDYVVEVAHDTLKDAKDYIDRMIELDEIIGEEEQKQGVKR